MSRLSPQATWTQRQEFSAHDILADDFFGEALAVSDTTAVIGNSDLRGRAYVFKKTGAGWVEAQELMPTTTGTSMFFGLSVAIFGSTIVIGDVLHKTGSTTTGAAYIFEKQHGIWVQTAELLVATNKDIGFGASVAVAVRP